MTKWKLNHVLSAGDLLAIVLHYLEKEYEIPFIISYLKLWFFFLLLNVSVSHSFSIGVDESDNNNNNNNLHKLYWLLHFSYAR